MHDLNAALVGIVVDISEGDREGAVANLESFVEQYRKNALLVPEWESWYPAEPAEELGQVVPSGTPEEVVAAVGDVGAVCHNCHLATMVTVQLKYHWPDFSTITVQDPVADAELDYPGLMQMLNANLTGVAIDLGRGQPENARAQLGAFQSNMVALSRRIGEESCFRCHLVHLPGAYSRFARP